MWILAPGFGAQGSNLKEAVFAGICQDKLRLLLSIQREIAQANDPKAAAKSFRDASNVARRDKSSHSKRVASNSTSKMHSFSFF